MENSFSESDFNCKICFFFLVEPVKLDCGHYFCLDCLQKYKTIKLQCPLDRKLYNSILTVDKNFQKQIKSKFLNKFLQNEKILSELKLKENEMIKIELWIGNSFDLYQGIKNKWSFTLGHKNEKINPFFLIKKIQFKLPEDFSSQLIHLEFPFIKSFISEKNTTSEFGIFFQEWMNQKNIFLKHQLVFREEGGKSFFTIEIRKLNYEKLVALIKENLDPYFLGF